MEAVCASGGVSGDVCSVACIFSLEKGKLRATTAAAALADSPQPLAKTRPKLNGKGWVYYVVGVVLQV